MFVHISIDDVICSFMKLCDVMPESIFDIPFFGLLKKGYERYGTKFTLYCWENYKESFFIREVPKKYWKELLESNFVRLGFHGTFLYSDVDDFAKKCDDFYSNIPQELWAKIVRVHLYQADEKKLEILRRYGVLKLLCRENESRIRQEFPDSYILSKEEEGLLEMGAVFKEDMSFQITHIRLEFHDEIQVKARVKEELARHGEYGETVIFTHEKFIDENPQMLESALEILAQYNVDYIN